MDHDAVVKLANRYAAECKAAATSGISAEPEAQLTVPVSNFLTGFARLAGLGDLVLVREAQLDGVRPDFAAAINGKQCGWIELKAPGHTLDGARWRGREKRQWEFLSELDSLIVTNGEAAALYFVGEELRRCELPFDGAKGWDPGPLEGLLAAFFTAQATPIKRVSQLAERLAPLAKFLRVKLEAGARQEMGSILEAKAAWDETVHETTSGEQFAGDVAQVVAYAMAIAGLSGEADLDHDGVVTLAEAKQALGKTHNSVLGAALGPVIGIPSFVEYIAPELGAIVRLISTLDLEAIQRSKDSRGEPWLWFYEDFLARYDPEARKKSGVYYTPTNVVRFQVRSIHDVLCSKFGEKLGFGSPSVVTLDPAAGSGTYPIAVIDQAVETAREERGPAGPRQVAGNLEKNVLAFEILPGPFAVAHLRIGQRLAKARGELTQRDELNVFLTDTLEDPSTSSAPGLFGDAKILSEQREEARKIKAEKQITVVLGNPPYARATQDEGGWIVQGDLEHEPLFEDVIKPAQDAGVIFSAQASLYNLYVYFWRWAIWKAFQNGPKHDAVVSFITASSWLDGPAFVGLRNLAAQTSSEVWVLDLGGSNRGARKEENVFDIQSPVAIVTLIRHGDADDPATIYYRRIRGTRAEKLAELDTIKGFHADDGWTVVPPSDLLEFIPGSDNVLWNEMPALADVFPWAQPGIKYNRLWPVAPTRELLEKRWTQLLSDDDADVRAERFVTASSGRNIHTKVAGLPTIAQLPVGADHERIVRMGWRSFDQQWAFDDPRLAKTDSPALWQSLSDKQVFLVSPGRSRISNGPAATVSVGVPDLHYFNNRGGKDVIPLYRDAAGHQPNVTRGLLDHLGSVLDRAVTPEDLLAYTYALIAHPGYTEHFDDELENSAVRVPMTADPELFDDAVALGAELLWLQTFGERFSNEGRPKHRVPKVSGLEWELPVTQIPATPKDIRYDAETRRLTVGDGVVTGVDPEVWEFEVSGMNVLDKWLGARTQKGVGRAAGAAAKPLDRIRPTQWADEWNDELLDLLRVLTRTVRLSGDQSQLLSSVLRGPLVPTEELPKPSPLEAKVPKTIPRGTETQETVFDEDAPLF